MSATVVTPPIAAERVPLGKSSLSVSPGSRMWTWRSTHPGRISASPWSIASSPRSVFFMAAIRPVSSIPMLKGSSRPRKKTRPLMTRTRRLQGRAHDGAARLGFREDLRLELVDPRRRVEPRVREEARLRARLGQELGCLPTVLGRDLREEKASIRTLRHAQSICAQGDVLREIFRLLHFDQLRRGQDADLNRHAVEFLRTQAGEPRILRGAFGAFLDRLDEGEERLRVSDAAPQQSTRMVVEGDERSGLLLEGLGDLNRASCASQNIGVEGFARDANRAFAFAVGIRHPPRQQDAYLNIVGAILRLRLATACGDLFRLLGHCVIGLATFIGPDLSFTAADHARAGSRRRNHDAVPGDNPG